LSVGKISPPSRHTSKAYLHRAGNSTGQSRSVVKPIHDLATLRSRE
jgi:hypothetical protein